MARLSRQQQQEELQSLRTEVSGGAGGRDGIMRTTTTTSSPSSSSSSSSSSFQTAWKMAAVLAFGVFVLFLSYSMEFQSLQGGDPRTGGGGADMDGLHGHVTHKDTTTTTSTSTSTTAAPAAAIAAEPAADATGATTTPPPAPAEVAAVPAAVVPEPAVTPELPAAVPATPNDSASASSASSTSTSTTTNRHTYTRRGQPLSDADRVAMITKWGSWTLVDEKKAQRPAEDIYSQYPQRDIPRADFPATAWQTDTDYLGKFLPESLKLVERAQEAILMEYGHGPEEGANRTKMFDLELHGDVLGDVDFPKYHAGEQGGWTTRRSWDGLKRRLLHAVMTEDIFVFAMGGHSAAAGHGNHFQQSYTLQVQWIMEAVFGRLGVRHQARNFGNGGLGTIHNGLAGGSIYGPDVDMLLWDSGMTEKDAPALDTFARQAMLGGDKVPVIWGLSPGITKPLHDLADADVGMQGNGRAGIMELTAVEDIDKIPWAAQYVSCSGELSGVCRENEYIGQCWIEREDFTPPKAQGTPGGRAKWHPGNRKHQVTGRILAFTILSALKDALTVWSDAPGYVLDDSVWHVHSYYENIQTKLKGLGPDVGACPQYVDMDLEFVCNYPMQSRTEFTPRAFPAHSSMRTLMPQAQVDSIVPPGDNLYEPPDVFNPALHPPPGEIDVLSIVEAGVDFESVLNPDYADSFYQKPTFAAGAPKVPIGKGIALDSKVGDSFCDGSVDSFCDRSATNNCLLLAHNDGRNGMKIDGFSGWVVMNLPNLKNGFVFVKFETWHGSGSNEATADWTSINNNEGGRQRQRNMLRHDGNSTAPTSSSGGVEEEEDYDYDFDGVVRNLKAPAPTYCDEFKFEYAIDGKITSLNLEEFQERRKQVQRVVETITLLKDPNYTGGVEKEVEVAFRITGCERVKTFRFSHVYWS